VIQPARSVARYDGRDMALDAVIQRFQLLEVVARGGMGTVYRARDPQLLRDVAIKVMSTDCVPAPLRSRATIDLRAAGPATRDELIDEARVMAQLSHPNVLPVYEVGLDGEQMFLVMEYIVGANLREWLARKPALATIRDAFVQAGEGLGAAHARGIVHRDFKPENVLVGSDGRVRVADFGLSRLAWQPAPRSLIRVTRQRGTPEYMAPELWRGEPATTASDVFAFSLAFVEAVLGERRSDPTIVERGLRARGVPAGLCRAVCAGLDDESARRPDIGQLVEQLRCGPARSRLRWFAALAAVAFATGAAATAIALRASVVERADLPPETGSDASPRWVAEPPLVVPVPQKSLVPTFETSVVNAPEKSPVPTIETPVARLPAPGPTKGPKRRPPHTPPTDQARIRTIEADGAMLADEPRTGPAPPTAKNNAGNSADSDTQNEPSSDNAVRTGDAVLAR
jgi:serine/threonine protein kinase